MTTNTLHTPLEVLLFFQSLHTIGSDQSSFTKISNLLKNNEFIQETEGFDPERLNPESLKNLYLQLLKDEVKAENRERISPAREGDRSSRKRKLSTPPLQSVDEAAQHKHLLPQLVNRLYARYREHVVKAIQEEERRYRTLSQEIHEIERGEWDARIEAEEEVARKRSKSLTSIHTLLHHEDEEFGAANEKISDAAGLAANPPPASFTHIETNGRTAVTDSAGRPTSPSQATAVLDGKKSHEIGGHHSRTSSTGGPIQTFSPREAFPSLSRPSSQSQSHGPILPLPFSASSPTSEGHRRLPPPQATINVPSMASPRLNQGPLAPPHERGSGSPIILPPPPGMLRSSGSPVGPLDPISDASGQPFRPNASLPSPRQNQMPPLPHPPALSQPRNYVQRPYPYYEPQTAHAPSYSSYGHPPYASPTQAYPPTYPPPQQHGYPPNTRPSGPPLPPQYQPPLPGYGAFQGYPPGQAPYQGPQTPVAPPAQASRAKNFVTPAPSTNGKRRLQGLPPLDTSVSSTKWKSTPRPSREPIRSPVPPDRSPYLPSSPSPSPEPERQKDRPEGTAYQSKKHIHGKGSISRPNDTPTRGSSKRGRWGTHSGRGRGRPPNNPSSALATSKGNRTRSQSVTSQNDELSMDSHPSSRKIKPEPPSTPAGVLDDTSAISTPAGDGRVGRGRRDTLRGPDTPKTGMKRKRANTLEGTPDFVPIQAPSRPNHVLASRNFPRTVAPLMHDIATHKLASMFAKPITEKDAPGYRSLIYQPQDLKSIRGAISAGSRTVAALADSTAEDVGSPAAGVKSSTLWIERAPDVLPPRGIVNSAQLEKEVTRMFANAVMFNPDPKRGFGPAFRSQRSSTIADGDTEDAATQDDYDDGGSFVRDAREMFEGVERSVVAWRAAERVGEDGRKANVDNKKEESEADELAGEEGSEEGLRRSRRG